MIPERDYDAEIQLLKTGCSYLKFCALKLDFETSLGLDLRKK